jgi:hypothetical protein
MREDNVKIGGVREWNIDYPENLNSPSILRVIKE